jgi:predicted ATP-dependent serine protease
MKRYRMLREGEIVRSTDEFYYEHHGHIQWKSAVFGSRIGHKFYLSEVQQYRRPITLRKRQTQAATDSRQLKQAIALVRRHAGLRLSIAEFGICGNCLNLIEQRAAV